MPVYLCYRGASAHFASLHEAGGPVILAQDALGRDWHCIDVGEREPLDAFPTPSMKELSEAHRQGNAKGMKLGGTEHRRIVCEDEADLRRQLISLRSEPGSEGGPTMATLSVQAAPMPLRTDEDGNIRVGDCRVLLDTVVREFASGERPETIVEEYPTLRLADVYLAIGYYLYHREEVDRYLKARDEEAEKLQREIESEQPDRSDLREKLLARRGQMEQDHASSGK